MNITIFESFYVR